MWNKFITVTNGVEPEPTPTPLPGRITASFDVSLHNGTVPLDVYFSDTSSGNPISWIWDFGDGKTSTLQNVTHRYTTAGTYSVTLLAQNSDFSGSITQPNAVIVN
jgi:PKD repeat protein